MTNIELRTLAPAYSEEDHKTYVARLNAAVSDLRNKNIALTGRYGAGKSSILDEFIKDQEKAPEPPVSRWSRLWQQVRRNNECPTKVLRISINTLGPDEREDLTNRIQKELVKQLVYRARPGEVQSSEFARTPRLSRRRAGGDALGVAVALVGLLWLFGYRPAGFPGAGDFWLPMAALFVLVSGILWAIRWHIGNRVVAQVSAGGASIALEGEDASFFDKYLDELMTFFETTEPDIVVFEDLDRFDDPRIFDSLRELNTLINTSAHWRDRPSRPLRFVYAIKDSLFEKLGDQQQEKDEGGQTAAEEESGKKDTAVAAVERANRTKFFEIVIPVVPFLSHSNARDHFLTELGKLSLPEGTTIDRGLIDIVARHTTDMRLMINIGNEFVVYAERLLWVDGARVTPGLSPDLLFALVVYKNFHLGDFEALPHRGSALDKLVEVRRDLVNGAIEKLQRERISLATGADRQQRQQELATKLGERLTVVLQSARMTLGVVTADDVALDVQAINEPSFWRPVALAKTVEMQLASSNSYGYWSKLDRTSLAKIFPEITDSRAWLDMPIIDDGKRLSEIDFEIAELRGADFTLLLGDDRYMYDGKTFAELAKDTLPSQLALDLIKQGHIDRFYAEYSTVFYGKFLGVEVANYFRNSVWPNEMDMQFKLTSEDAQNVVEHAPADFLRTRSALNIDIVNHLMTLDASSSSDLIDFMVRPNNEEGHQFLAIYFNTPESQGEELVSRLAAKPWSGLFRFIASECGIGVDDTNVRLLNVALLSAPSLEAFELDDAARELVARLHTEIPAFQQAQRGASVKTLFAFLTAALPSIPKLRTLSPELRNLAVNAEHYELTIDNLRVAAALTNEDSISADNLITSREVWAYCAENIEDYLELVESDAHANGCCESPEVLAHVVNQQQEDWSTTQMEAFLDAAAESAALPDITEVTQRTAWTTVVARSRALPNLTNLAAYATELDVDDELAALLTDRGGSVVDIIGLENATEDQLEPLIPLLLNAHAALEPRQRVLLAKQLWDSPARPEFDYSEINASPDELLAELLREGMVDDSEEVFTHFSTAGWPSIGPALRVSTEAASFITPGLIQGHAAAVVREKGFPEETRCALLKYLADLAPTEDQSFLDAAATTARTLRVSLSTDDLTLIAPVVRNHEDIVWQLKEQGTSIAASEAMRILGSMSGDFAGFAGASGHKFVVGDTPSLKTVLDRLKAAHEIALQQGGQPSGRWKLRIV